MSDVPSKSNPWFAISMGLIGIIVGYGIAAGTGQGGFNFPAKTGDQPAAEDPTPTPPPPPAGEVTPYDANTDHMKGDPDAIITLFEYSDFECPFCGRHAPTVEQVLEEYGDDVNVVFRHFPLSFHTNAQKAAEATECAADQGGDDAFWEFHDKLFESGVEQGNYATYAEEIGLNVSDFNDCLDSGKFEQKVKDDMDSGVKAGVRGTPGNILFNNETEESKSVSGAQPFANFQGALDEMLGK